MFISGFSFLVLEVEEVSCNVHESLPTGQKNLSIPKGVFYGNILWTQSMPKTSELREFIYGPDNKGDGEDTNSMTYPHEQQELQQTNNNKNKQDLRINLNKNITSQTEDLGGYNADVEDDFYGDSSSNKGVNNDIKYQNVSQDPVTGYYENPAGENIVGLMKYDSMDSTTKKINFEIDSYPANNNNNDGGAGGATANYDPVQGNNTANPYSVPTGNIQQVGNNNNTTTANTVDVDNDPEMIEKCKFSYKSQPIAIRFTIKNTTSNYYSISIKFLETNDKEDSNLYIYKNSINHHTRKHNNNDSYLHL